MRSSHHQPYRFKTHQLSNGDDLRRCVGGGAFARRDATRCTATPRQI